MIFKQYNNNSFIEDIYGMATKTVCYQYRNSLRLRLSNQLKSKSIRR